MQDGVYPSCISFLAHVIKLFNNFIVDFDNFEYLNPVYSNKREHFLFNNIAVTMILFNKL